MKEDIKNFGKYSIMIKIKVLINGEKQKIMIGWTAKKLLIMVKN
jgi:hypothetical protein